MKRTDELKSLIHRAAGLSGRWTACAALIAALWIPHQAVAQAIAVRPTGEIDVVVQGPSNSLVYYVSFDNGSTWIADTIAGAGSTMSEPTISVRPNGEADIVTVGPNSALLYYWARPNAAWQVLTITNLQAPYGPPALSADAKRADIVLESAGAVKHLWSTTNRTTWHSQTVARKVQPDTNPSVAVRSTGEVDVVYSTLSGALMYYYLLPGSTTWLSTELMAKRSHGTPSISVNSDGLAAVAVYNDSFPAGIDTFTATPGSGWTKFFYNTPAFLPSVAVRSTGEIDMAATGGPYLFDYLVHLPNGLTVDQPVGPQTTITSAPAFTVDSTGQANVAVIAPGNSLVYYSAVPNGAWSSSQIAGAGSAY